MYHKMLNQGIYSEAIELEILSSEDAVKEDYLSRDNTSLDNVYYAVEEGVVDIAFQEYSGWKFDIIKKDDY